MSEKIGYERQGTGYDPHAAGHEAVGRDRAPTPDSIAMKHLKEDAEFTVEVANAKIDALVAALRGFNLEAHRIVGAQGDEIVVRLPRAAFVAAAEALAPYALVSEPSQS